MGGASHYLWTTLVIPGPGQGITQEDVARSLFDVVTCPHDGIPRCIVIDNEHKWIEQAIIRLSTMSEIAGLGTVTCLPYSPEGKGRPEGAFGIWEDRVVSALPGYIVGDRMKSPPKSKGKPVDPYPHGPKRLVEDLALATGQFNGTPQDGYLGGLPPKAMLEAKIAASGRAAQIPDAETFDLVFSREIHRDVRKGNVSCGTRTYSGPVLADLIGAKQVPFPVPVRDPDGPILHVGRNETGKPVIHHLEHETFGQLDRDGARARWSSFRRRRSDVARKQRI